MGKTFRGVQNIGVYYRKSSGNWGGKIICSGKCFSEYLKDFEIKANEIIELGKCGCCGKQIKVYPHQRIFYFDENGKLIKYFDSDKELCAAWNKIIS